MGSPRATVAILLGVVVCLVAVPPLLGRFSPDDGRILEGTALADTVYEDVHFRNEEQGLDLAGMLFWPQGDGPFPAVVIIHGAGTSKRDNHWYLRFVTDLQKNGIAVLLPDKRGSEFSEGNWRTSSFQDLATDAEAAIDFLRTEFPDKVAEIGVLGSSQGGQVAPIVATQSEDVAYVVNLVGSAMPFHDALVYEENHNLREMGFLPGISDLLARPSSWNIRNNAQKEFWDVIGNYSPLPYWQQVNVPGLILLGADDTNTDSATSAGNLEALDNPHLRVMIWQGSGHPLEDPVGVGDSIFREDALAALREFIHDSTSASTSE